MTYEQRLQAINDKLDWHGGRKALANYMSSDACSVYRWLDGHVTPNARKFVEMETFASLPRAEQEKYA